MQMLRYRVLLPGPGRESRGKVRVSPKWCSPRLPGLTPFKLPCAALTCVLPPALTSFSPATRQNFHFNFLPLLLYFLHLLTSFCLGLVLSLRMFLDCLQALGPRKCHLVRVFCGYTLQEGRIAEDLATLIALVNFPTAGRWNLSVYGMNHGFLFYHLDVLNCKLSLNHLFFLETVYFKKI